jgi:hypothetical protein
MQVSFKPQIFCQEFLFNFFGVLATPLMLSIIGCKGMAHRWFVCNCKRARSAEESAVYLHQSLIPWLPCCCVMRAGNVSSIHQLVHLAIVMGLNSLFMMFKMNGWPVAITVTEVVITNVLVALRAATVAAKYSFFSDAEYAQTIKAPVDGWNDQRKRSKLVLGGWIAPTDNLLYLELERAAARNAPGMDTMTIVYPSDTARLTALAQMAESLPAFLQNESAIMHPRCVEFLRAVERGEDVEPLLRADAMRLGDRLGHERRSKSRVSMAGMPAVAALGAYSQQGSYPGSPERLLLRQFTPSSPGLEGAPARGTDNHQEESPVPAVGGAGGAGTAFGTAKAPRAPREAAGTTPGGAGAQERYAEHGCPSGVDSPSLPPAIGAAACGAAAQVGFGTGQDAPLRGYAASEARRLSVTSEAASRSARGLAGASAMGSQSFRLGRATSRGRPPTGWANMQPVRLTAVQAEQRTRQHFHRQPYQESAIQASHAAHLGVHVADMAAPPSMSQADAFGPLPMLAGGSWPLRPEDVEEIAPTPAERLISAAVLGEATSDADAAVRDALAGIIAAPSGPVAGGMSASHASVTTRPAEGGVSPGTTLSAQQAGASSRMAELRPPQPASRLGVAPASKRQPSLEERIASTAGGGARDPGDDQAMLYDSSGMATLPAKLVAWHAIRTSHGGLNVAGAAFFGTKAIGLSFALIPVLVRAYLGGSLMKILSTWSPVEIGVQIALIWLSYTNSRITIAFCALGVIDLWRRFAAQVTLHRLLDIKSPLTLEMHDALVRSAGGTFLKAMGLPSTESDVGGQLGADGNGLQPVADAKHVPFGGIATNAGARISHKPGIPVAIRSGHDKGMAPAQQKVKQQRTEHRQALDEAEAVLRRRAGRHRDPDSRQAPRSRAGMATPDPAHARTSIQAWQATWDKASKRYLGTPQTEPDVVAQTQHRPPNPVSPVFGDAPAPAVDASDLPDHAASRLFAAHITEDNRRKHATRLAAVAPEFAASSSSATGVVDGDPGPECDQYDTVRRLIVSQATWLGPLQAEKLVEKRVQHLRVPVFYPQNLLSWLHLRNTASDFGRSYAMRIQLYTLYFMALVCVIVVAQVVLFFDLADTPTNEAAIILTLGTFTEVVFAIVVLVQMTTAARTNRSISFQRRRFNRIEAMTQDLLCGDTELLAPSTELRLKKCRKVLSLLAKSLDSEGDLNPVRVMFLPADFRLVASFLSIAGSGVLAALAQLRSLSWGG